jgi:hypothetical protein
MIEWTLFIIFFGVNLNWSDVLLKEELKKKISKDLLEWDKMFKENYQNFTEFETSFNDIEICCLITKWTNFLEKSNDTEFIKECSVVFYNVKSDVQKRKCVFACH